MPIEMTNAEKEWDKAMNSQRSIISDLFFGQLRSTITCSFCKQASTTYETFNSLTMSLSQSNRCTLNVSILQNITFYIYIYKIIYNTITCIIHTIV